MEGGTFTLADGTISGNTALYGGEVYVSNYGTGQTFTKTGGIVYGDSPANTTHTPGSTANTATDTTPANIGKNGHAVLLYRYSGTPRACSHYVEPMDKQR
jgi:hypothetical protein